MVVDKLSVRLVVLVAVLLVVSAGHCPAQVPTSDTALILYDSTGEWGWLGDLYAQEMANLLGHFPMDAVREPIEQYTAGQLHDYDVTFYIGSVYDNPIPQSFFDDLSESTTPVCWLKYNLWQIAWDEAGWHDPEFAARYGFQFLGLDWSQWDRVLYKGVSLTRDATDPQLGFVEVVDPDLATVPAWALRPPYEGPEASCPYVVRGGNLWYVSDIPFSYATADDRYLAFCDLLHDIVGIDHAERHLALIRIEDVSADTDPGELRAMTDALAERGIPFQVGVVPCYRDPLMEYNTLRAGFNYTLDRTPELLEAIRYTTDHGGSIVAHGYTHQYDSTTNPDTGKTGDDYEFYRVTLDADENQVYEGPVPMDSAAWAQSRMTAARRALRSMELEPVAWEVPHYMASADDFQGFADVGGLMYHRSIYFAEAGGAPVSSSRSPISAHLSRLRPADDPQHPAAGRGRNPLRGQAVAASTVGEPVYMLGQFFPYVIQRDVYGQKLAPENLHYLEPVEEGGIQLLPEDLLEWAEMNLVIRDGWASAYCHPDVDVRYLEQLVDGIRLLGYEFVPVSPEME